MTDFIWCFFEVGVKGEEDLSMWMMASLVSVS